MRIYLPLILILLCGCNYLKPAKQREAEANEAKCIDLGYNWVTDEYVNKVLDRGPMSKTVDTAMERSWDWTGERAMVTVTLVYDELEIVRSTSTVGEKWAKGYEALMLIPFYVYDNSGKKLNSLKFSDKYSPLSRATERRIQNLLNHRR